MKIEGSIRPSVTKHPHLQTSTQSSVPVHTVDEITGTASVRSLHSKRVHVEAEGMATDRSSAQAEMKIVTRRSCVPLLSLPDFSIVTSPTTRTAFTNPRSISESSCNVALLFTLKSRAWSQNSRHIGKVQTQGSTDQSALP